LQVSFFGFFFYFRNIKCLLPENIQGFILNTPSECKWGLLHFPFKRKHWIAVRKIEEVYYNLDSKLDSPEPIGDKESLFSFLHRELQNGEKELLIVVSKEVDREGAWRRDDDSETPIVSNGNNAATSKAILQPLDDL
jgi:josephin